MKYKRTVVISSPAVVVKFQIFLESYFRIRFFAIATSKDINPQNSISVHFFEKKGSCVFSIKRLGKGFMGFINDTLSYVNMSRERQHASNVPRMCIQWSRLKCFNFDEIFVEIFFEIFRQNHVYDSESS